MDHLETGRAALDGADPKARARLIAARFEAVLAEEIPARRALEKAARNLRNKMDGSKRYARR